MAGLLLVGMIGRGMIWRRGRSVVCVGGIWIPEWEKKLNSFLCISFSYVLFLKLRVPYIFSS